MKTSLDFPDPLFCTLRARATLQGSSLKKLLVTYVERGLRESQAAAAQRPEDHSWEAMLDSFTQTLLGAAAPRSARPTPTRDDYNMPMTNRRPFSPKP